MNYSRAGRLIKRPALFLSLFFLFPASSFPIAPEAELKRLELIKLVSEKELWKEPDWTRLLYYEKNIFGRFRGTSVKGEFYLSKWGKINPKLELEAVVNGFFFEGPADDGPQCRFPQRTSWLRENLSLGPSEFPVPFCPSFEEWRKIFDVESVSLLFAAGYLNNPSTLYGHTFLRLHTKGSAGADLLDYTVNYAANAGDDGGIFFALKGLVGAYPGQFSTMPYYLKIQEYHNLENRDLWEFPLNLKRVEIDRLMRHAWELGKAAFPYRFFTRNCSWQLLPLLDISKPELDLSSKFHFQVIPSDTAKAIISASEKAEPVWRPSLWKTVEWKRARLSPEEREYVRELACSDQPKTLEKVSSLGAERKAAVLETAVDYLSWRFYARKIDKEELDKKTDPLLAERASLGPRNTFSGKPAQPPSITEAHESGRLGLGLVSLKNGPAYEIQWRFALQDILDDPTGYLPDAALEMASLRFRYEQRYNRLYLNEGKLAHVLSLNPWDDWVRRQSWEISAGIEQAAETGRRSGSSAVWAMSGATGFAAETFYKSRQLWYLMAEADCDLGSPLEPNWRVGAGFKAGVISEKAPFRFLGEARYISYGFGDTDPLWAVKAAASFRLSGNNSLRLEHSRRGETKETGIYFHHFMFPF